MKNISIKERVVLWFAIILMIVISILSCVYIYFSVNTVTKDAKEDLINVVDESLDDIHIDKGELLISDTMDYEVNGVTVAIFNKDNVALSGMLAQNFDAGTGFQENSLRKVKSGNRSFYVYDRLIDNKKSGKIWVRGVKSAEIGVNEPRIAFGIKMMFIGLPIIYLIAIFGGWFVINHAFRPLTLIADTASGISTGDDLSRRIGVGTPDSEDEVLKTAGAFDKMMDRVEMSFENEKEFTDNASHELRTPTAVILSESEYAMTVLDDKDEIKHSLEKINKKANEMSSIVEQLLILARADKGAQNLNKERVDISLIAEEAAFGASDIAKERGISINVYADAGIYMDVDSTFFAMMYRNLLTNSIKYGRENGKVDISCKIEDDNIVIEVKDDGIGISEEDLRHIYERFYRSSRTSEVEGTGLGLALVKWIVDEHGGDIKCESEIEIGTKVTIRFPL